MLTNDNEESRRMIEQCYKRHKTTLNPIIDWSDRDVWDFIKSEGISYCSLYDEGFKRLGCIGCPMASQNNRIRDFNRWPKFKQAYINAFEKMLLARKEKNRPWKQGGTLYESATAQDVFNWWLEFDILPGQISFEDYEDEED